MIGSGGREHALVMSLLRSASAPTVEVIPGNPGMPDSVIRHPINMSEASKIVDICRGADVVIIGPEQPLVEGLADVLRTEGIPVVGPSASAAELEGSKSFAKSIMDSVNVPTARWARFTEAQAAKAFAQQFSNGVAIKADGLAAGKGVIVANTRHEADQAIDELMAGAHGGAGRVLIVEERLVGQELSVLALCDGENLRVLPAAQDHKRLLNADQGPNTGGMGAYTPPPVATPEMINTVIKQCMKPVIDKLKSLGKPLVGILYAGIMLTEEGPKVLEYNVRFGDPETQAILPMLEEDLYQLFLDTARGHLEPGIVRVREGASVTVVIASAGYPTQTRTGDIIYGLDQAAKLSDVHVYHAGTAYTSSENHQTLCTAGGRVLGVTGFGKNLESAAKTAYEGVRYIKFDGMQYRTDIAHRALKPNTTHRT